MIIFRKNKKNQESWPKFKIYVPKTKIKISEGVGTSFNILQDDILPTKFEAKTQNFKVKQI